MKNIVVTGGNKGIGYALVTQILNSRDDTYVFLGARDQNRGNQALDTLIAAHPHLKNRVEMLLLDVADDASVKSATAFLREKLDTDTHPLYGIVNNAGIGLADSDLEGVLQVNTYGMRRVCLSMISLLNPKGGRVVNITSAAGPNFVSRCSPQRQKFLINPDISWLEIETFMAECLAVGGGAAAFEAQGLGQGSPYGISKACANALTLYLAKEHPHLSINACTPGYIETDLTRPIAAAKGKSPSEMGMKPPPEGTISPLFLLFGNPEGSGHYYGSDALRSPLDRYRSPGAPAYTGD